MRSPPQVVVKKSLLPLMPGPWQRGCRTRFVLCEARALRSAGTTPPSPRRSQKPKVRKDAFNEVKQAAEGRELEALQGFCTCGGSSSGPQSGSGNCTLPFSRCAVSSQKLAKWAGESNALVLDAALKALQCVLQWPEGVAAVTGSLADLASPLAEKGLPSSKASTAASAQECILAVAAAEGPASVLPALASAVSNPRRKRGHAVAWGTLTALAATPAGAAGLQAAAADAQGPWAALMSQLPSAVQASDKATSGAAAEAAAALLAAAPAPTHAALAKFADKLPPQVQTALAAAGAGSGTAGSAAAGGAAADAAGTPPGRTICGIHVAEQDAEQFQAAQPVDVFKAVRAAGVGAALSSKKWAERHGALESARGALEAAGLRVAGGAREWSELVGHCRTAIGDAHVKVAVAGMQLLTALALRVRGPLHGPVKGALPTLTSRLKDKKAAAAAAAVEGILGCTKACLTLDDLEETLAAVGGSSKEAALNVATLTAELASCEGLLPDAALSPAGVQRLGEVAALAMGHKLPAVREAGEEALAALLSRVHTESSPGDEHATLAPILKRLAKQHAHAVDRVRVRAGLASADSLSAAAALGMTAEVGGDATATSDAPPAAAAAPAARSQRPTKSARAPATAAGEAAQLSSSVKGATAAAPTSASGDLFGPDTAVAPAGDMPDADAAKAALGSLPGVDLSGLQSAKWQDKVQVMESLGPAVAGAPDAHHALRCALAALAASTNGFKALSNANLLKGIAGVVEVGVRGLDAPTLAWALRGTPLGQKLKEAKARGGAAMTAMLHAAASVIGPAQVCRQLLALGSGPKTLLPLRAAVSGAVAELVAAHGAGAFPSSALQAMVAWAAGDDTGVGSSNRAVKAGASTLLDTLHVTVGPRVSAWLSAAAPGMREATAAALKSAWEAAGYDGAWSAARASAERAPDASSAAEGGTVAAFAAWKEDPSSVVGLAPLSPELQAAYPVPGSGAKGAGSGKSTAGQAAAGGGAADSDALKLDASIRAVFREGRGLEAALVDMANTEGPAEVTDDRKAWQIRAEAVDAVREAADKAAASTLGLLVDASVKAALWGLRAACADGAVAVKPKAAAAIEAIAKATPTGALTQWTKGVAPALLKLVPDKKTLVRGGALAALTAWVGQGLGAADATAPHPPSLDTLLPVMRPAFKAATGADVLMQWVTPLLDACPPGTLAAGTAAIAPALTTLAGARAVGTRQAAGPAITAAARHCGVGAFKAALGALPEGTRRATEGAVKAALEGVQEAEAPPPPGSSGHGTVPPPLVPSSAPTHRSAASIAAAARRAARNAASQAPPKGTAKPSTDSDAAAGRSGASSRRLGGTGRSVAAASTGRSTRSKATAEPELSLLAKRGASADRQARARRARGQVWLAGEAGALGEVAAEWRAAGCIAPAAVLDALLSTRHKDAERAMTALEGEVAAHPEWLSLYLDCVLRLIAVRLRSSKSTTVGVAQSFLRTVLAFYEGCDCGLAEVDMAAIALTLGETSGATREATRAAFRSLLRTLTHLAVLVSTGQAENAKDAPASGPLALAGMRSLLHCMGGNLSEMKNRKSVAEIFTAATGGVELMGGHFAAAEGAAPSLSRLAGREVFKAAAAGVGGRDAEVREAALGLLLAAAAYYTDTSKGALSAEEGMQKALRLAGGEEALGAKGLDMLTQRAARLASAGSQAGQAAAAEEAGGHRARPVLRGGGKRSAGAGLPPPSVSVSDPELAGLAKSLQAALSPEHGPGGETSDEEGGEGCGDAVPLAHVGGSEGAVMTPRSKGRNRRRETGIISSNEIHKHVAAGVESPSHGPFFSPAPQGPSQGAFATPHAKPHAGQDGGLASPAPEAATPGDDQRRASMGGAVLQLVLDEPSVPPSPAPSVGGASVASGASQDGALNLLDATRLDMTVAGGDDGAGGDLAAVRSVVAPGTPDWMVVALHELYAAQRVFTDAVSTARAARRGGGSAVDTTVAPGELPADVGTVSPSHPAYAAGLRAVAALQSRLESGAAVAAGGDTSSLAPWKDNARLLLKALTTLTTAAFGGSIRPTSSDSETWRAMGHPDMSFAVPCVELLGAWFSVPTLAGAVDAPTLNSVLMETTQRCVDVALPKAVRAAVSKVVMRMTFRAPQDATMLALVGALSRASVEGSGGRSEAAAAHTGRTRMPKSTVRNMTQLLGRSTSHEVKADRAGASRPYQGFNVPPLVTAAHEFMVSQRCTLAETPGSTTPLYAVLVLLRHLVQYRVHDTLGALRGGGIPPTSVVWTYVVQFVKQLAPDVARAEGFAGDGGVCAGAPEVVSTLSKLTHGKSAKGTGSDEVGGVTVLNAVISCYARALQVALSSGLPKSEEGRAMRLILAVEEAYPELASTMANVAAKVAGTPAKEQILKAKRMVYRSRAPVAGGSSSGGGRTAHEGDALDTTYSDAYARLAARLGGDSEGVAGEPQTVTVQVSPAKGDSGATGQGGAPAASPPTPTRPADASAAEASEAAAAAAPRTPPHQGTSPARVGVSPLSLAAGATGIPRTASSVPTADAVLGNPGSVADSSARTASLRSRMASLKSRLGGTRRAAGGDSRADKEN